MKNEDIIPRFKQKLRASVDRLRHKFPEFDKQPSGVQFGMLDMEYNMNNNFRREFIDPKSGKKKGWPSFFAAYDREDRQEMAVQSHRKDVQKERNEAVYKSFLQED